MITIETWSAARAGAEATSVFQVYDAVFGDVPDEVEWRQSTYERHLARDGFRLTAALDERDLIGFAYGYVGHRGQLWPDKVAEALPPEVVAEWVGGHFEFVELGVLPEYRRRHIGSRLHDELMADGWGDRALLGTVDDPRDPAVLLYRTRGWRKLGNLNADVQVMGLRRGGDRVGP